MVPVQWIDNLSRGPEYVETVKARYCRLEVALVTLMMIARRLPMKLVDREMLVMAERAGYPTAWMCF